MRKLKNVFWGTILFLAYFLMGFIFDGNHKWMSFFVLLITFIVSIFYFGKQSKSVFKGLLILVGPLFFTMILVLIFGGSLKLLFVYLLFMPFCSYLAWVFINSKKYSIVLVGGVVICFASFVFFPNLGNYLINSNSRTNVVFPNVGLMDEQKSLVEINKNKIVVLDFWTTSCGVCFKKFPEFENLYLSYKSNPNIEFYSVNVPLKRDSIDSTIKLVRKLNYKFPTLYGVSEEDIEKKLRIDGYPHYVIIKNKNIRFEGFLNIDKDVFVYNFISELERVINEP